MKETGRHCAGDRRVCIIVHCSMVIEFCEILKYYLNACIFSTFSATHAYFLLNISFFLVTIIFSLLYCVIHFTLSFALL